MTVHPAIPLALLGAAGLAATGDLHAAPRVAVAVMLAWGIGVVALPRPAGGARAVLAAALAVRAVLLLGEGGLSDDLYRYLWEGRAVLLGGNPYRVPPADPSWEALAPADPVRALVNHPELTAVYPPLVQWFFAGLAALWYDPRAVRAAMGLADALTAWTLARVLAGRGRRLDGAWLYALLPLGAVESASSGHLDALAVLFLVLAIHAWDRRRGGLGWAGLGMLVKLLPGALVVAMARRRPGAVLAVAALAALAALPFADAGARAFASLDTYARHWSFNAGAFALFDALLGRWARPAAILVGAAVSAWALLRRPDPAELALWVGGAFVVLSPTVHPWYVAWAWVPALVVGVRAWTLLAVLVPLAYVVLASQDPVTGRWSEAWWTAPAIHLPFLAALLWESARHAIRPGPWAPSPATTASPSRSRT